MGVAKKNLKKVGLGLVELKSGCIFAPALRNNNRFVDRGLGAQQGSRIKAKKVV